MKILMMSLCLALVSCSSLNSYQDQELKVWQAKNLVVKDKDPGLAAALNVLPGIGDFYNGNIGYGIGNLLLWPISILWAPVGGASGAHEVNYYVTKVHVESLETKKKKLKDEVETAFVGKTISKEEFALASKKIDHMELKEFESVINFQDLLPKTASGEEVERQPSSSKK